MWNNEMVLKSFLPGTLTSYDSVKDIPMCEYQSHHEIKHLSV